MQGEPRARPLVSVALGTHNGSRHLLEQLASILAQTVPVDEIVLSDDDSRDGTVELASRRMAEHWADGGTTTLRVIRNAKALGVTANFEQALLGTSGEYLVLCDQDDVWHPDRVARSLERFASQQDLLLVASDARLIDDDGTPLGHALFEAIGIDARLARRLQGGDAFGELLRRNLVTGATVMLRRRLLEQATPFPDSWVHDEWLAIVAALHRGVGVIHEPLIDYRQHASNQIGAAKITARARIRRLTVSRTARNARLLARAQALADRVAEVGADAGQRRLVHQKLVHERVRNALPPERHRRLVPVLREWRTGRYRAFGRGAQDVLRDLVQPV